MRRLHNLCWTEHKSKITMDSNESGVKRRRFHITDDDDDEDEAPVPRIRDDDADSNPDAYLGEDEQNEDDEIDGEDLADTWLKYVA